MKMLRLKGYYGIFGGDFDYPIKDLGPSDWVPWYKLALAIASELDESLKIVDAKPRSKTAPRWRGGEGRVLLSLVKALSDAHLDLNCPLVSKPTFCGTLALRPTKTLTKLVEGFFRSTHQSWGCGALRLTAHAAR